MVKIKHNEFYKAIKTDICGHCQVEDIYNIAEHMKSLQKVTTLYSKILAFITGQLLCQGREKIKCILTNPDGIKITASHQVISYRPANLQNMQIFEKKAQKNLEIRTSNLEISKICVK